MPMNFPTPDNILTRCIPPPILAGVMAMLCYAGTFIVVRDFAGVIPPAAITFLRCTIALARAMVQRRNVIAAGGMTPAKSRTTIKVPA